MLATESYEDMIDRLYECKWHELPISLQKYFILMIQNAQQPVYYHGFGVALLNMQTFTKVSSKMFISSVSTLLKHVENERELSIQV